MLAKLVAGCEKDIAFALEVVAAGLASKDTLLARVPLLPVAGEHQDAVERRVRAL